MEPRKALRPRLSRRIGRSGAGNGRRRRFQRPAAREYPRDVEYLGLADARLSRIHLRRKAIRRLVGRTRPAFAAWEDRKRDVAGQDVSVRVDLVGRLPNKKK